jgi:hypothetical protein
MIPAGIVNALVTWATGDDSRIAQLTDRRDAIVLAILSGDPSAVAGFMAVTLNGKNAQFFQGISVPEQLTILTSVLESLGAVDPAPATISYGNFSCITR